MSVSRIVQERVLSVPPDAVFHAWSDASTLGAWMCPGDVAGADVEMDFRVGGRFRIVMHGAERDYAQHGVYLEIDPPHRLVFTWVSEWLPEPERCNRVELTLAPAAGNRTHLRLVHDEIPATGAYAGHQQGWTTILAKLERHLARAAHG